MYLLAKLIKYSYFASDFKKRNEATDAIKILISFPGMLPSLLPHFLIVQG